MRRLAILALAVALSGCVASDAPLPSPSESVVIDADRPDTEFGEVVTGPAVGPDVNATTAEAPRLALGEWWRIRFTTGFAVETPEVVRVVAHADEDGYIMGMPHEGWYKEAIAFHAPAFGDVGLDLSYNTHNEKFEPVRFPLVEGNSWETVFATAHYTATVVSADEYEAEIEFTVPDGEAAPTDPIMQVLGFAPGDVAMRLFYDARQHEIVRMESFVGFWEVIEHGYDFEGWVTVPRGEHTAIDYGTFWPQDVDPPSQTRTVSVEGGFNRLTMMHLIGTLAPGSYRIRSVTPAGDEFVTESTTEPFLVKFYEAADPDGEWTQEDFVAGAAATYSMGIAYHQYDIRLPDGLRRSDHSHEVIR